MTTDLGLSGFDRWAPSDAVIAAEIAVAGAAMQSKTALEEASELVTAEDFFSPARSVFAAALALLADGKPVDPTSVFGELTARGDAERVGGGTYLGKLMEHAAIGGSVTYHARRIAADARRRRIHLACSQGIQVAEGADWDAETDVDRIRKLIDEAAASRDAHRDTDLVDVVTELLDELENPPTALVGVAPPYLDLERDYIPTFKPGQLIVIAARPSVGKSLVAVDIARSVALRDGQRAVLFTLEMSKKEVLSRMFAAEASVKHDHITSRRVSPDDLEKISQASWRVTESPLVIDDSPNCSLEHIRSRLRSLSRTGETGIVIIDYLQLLKSPAKIDIREQQVAAQSRGLKLMAREFGVPIVLLAQLNRGPTQRADAVPRMSEIRESGAVEQDADIVILLHREDFYEPESKRAGEVDLIIEKNRGGKRGTVTLAHQLHYSRFVDMAGYAPPGRPNLYAV
ncbi:MULTISPECIES: DnaB-like helicase C-terminal domain-containing protein [Streptosporangiaceae]|uniref:replicative DNA helicase n=1 Tax=Streptosporangiaceae TaxID=2004 RepID=UPI0033C70689